MLALLSGGNIEVNRLDDALCDELCAALRARAPSAGEGMQVPVYQRVSMVAVFLTRLLALVTHEVSLSPRRWLAAWLRGCVAAWLDTVCQWARLRSQCR